MHNIKTLILISLFVSACATEQIRQQQALESAAGAFLTAIDQGNYLETWSKASASIHAKVEQDDWAVHIGNTRRPLGSLNHRDVVSIELHDSLEEMPDGNYALLTFESSFANNGSASEVVGLALDDDLTWRVIGYYIP